MYSIIWCPGRVLQLAYFETQQTWKYHYAPEVSQIFELVHIASCCRRRDDDMLYQAMILKVPNNTRQV
jgi:hypothetical protein